MKENIWVGLIAGCILGFILTSLLSLFLFYGGDPKGVFIRIDDLRQEIAEISQEGNNDVQELNKLFVDLEERVTKEENRNWYGK